MPKIFILFRSFQKPSFLHSPSMLLLIPHLLLLLLHCCLLPFAHPLPLARATGGLPSASSLKSCCDVVLLACVVERKVEPQMALLVILVSLFLVIVVFQKIFFHHLNLCIKNLKSHISKSFFCSIYNSTTFQSSSINLF